MAGSINQTLDPLKYQKILSKNQKKILELEKIKGNLKICGNIGIKKLYCKQCEAKGSQTESLLSVRKGVINCKMRYCSKPDCITQRFADTFNALKNLRRFEKVRVLKHCVIGFAKISKHDFENNYKEVKKRHEHALRLFMKKLKEKGVNLEGYRILDISKGKYTGEWNGLYYLHYHLGLIPFKRENNSKWMLKIHEARKEIAKKNKIHFSFKSFDKLVKKNALFSYLAIRSIGLFKPYEEKKPNYKIYEVKKLKESIKNGNFITLDKLVNVSQYHKLFFRSRYLTAIGNKYYCYKCKKEFAMNKVVTVKEHIGFDKKGRKKYKVLSRSCPHCNSKEVKLNLQIIRQGSITGDNSDWICCKYHGLMKTNDRSRVRVELEITLKPPPPDLEGKFGGFKELILVNATKAIQTKIINGEEVTVIKHNYKKVSYLLDSSKTNEVIKRAGSKTDMIIKINEQPRKNTPGEMAGLELFRQRINKEIN